MVAGVNYSCNGTVWFADLTPAESMATKAFVASGGIYADAQMVGYENEQPAAITLPLTSIGRLAARFGAGMWTTLSGAQVLTQGYTGWNGAGVKTGITSRTGQPEMLRVVPAANTTEQIELQTFGTNMLTPALGGVMGLWVYVEAQRGYQVGGTPTGTISISISTNASNYTNGLVVAWNANQLREGWNFLEFRMRNPLAYQTGTGQSEDNPFGVIAFANGTGAEGNILNTAAGRIKIYWDNMLGTTLYFDSIWTGFASKAQFVLGCDQGPLLEEVALPAFQSYGWTGYCAFPFNVADTGGPGSTVQVNMTAPAASANLQLARLYAAGWDVINHTMTHPNLGAMTSEGPIHYQVEMSRSWLQSNEFLRGCEFYASPASSSSRLSEAVIKTLGFKLQRHARKSNTSITAFGVDNPQHLGGLGWGSNAASAYTTCTAGVNGITTGQQTFTKVRRAIDVMEAYGATCIVWWHGITNTGDTGSGEDLTGDNLLMTTSAFLQSLAYLRQRELAGGLTVSKGMTGFWYGSN
jgi:hypothetical protein